MNAGLLNNVRSWCLMLALAVMLAAGAIAAPAVMDQVVGTNLANAVHACGTSAGGC